MSVIFVKYYMAVFIILVSKSDNKIILLVLLYITSTFVSILSLYPLYYCYLSKTFLLSQYYALVGKISKTTLGFEDCHLCFMVTLKIFVNKTSFLHCFFT